jgi:ComF family protein
MSPLARPLGKFMNRALPVDAAFDVAVPVPLHWRKKLDRGFNQAELLAREVAGHRGIPVSRALRRRKAGAVQASLSLAERRRNVAGVFELTTKPEIAGKRILLIDDVMTTGATASACASVLKRAGAKSVALLTIARVDRRL